MKITSVRIQLDPTEDGEGVKPLVAEYNAFTGEWLFAGKIRPKHLKIMTSISDMCRAADAGGKKLSIAPSEDVR